mgnify:CR=1 FL=1
MNVLVLIFMKLWACLSFHIIYVKQNHVRFAQGLANFDDSTALTLEADSVNALDVVLAARSSPETKASAEALATKIAALLMGKGKPTFADHMDSGDFVVVVNASKIVVTSDRLVSKRYHTHSGHPGGYRAETLGDLNARKPTEAIRRAVKGMLPKNVLGRQMFTKLKVYATPDHPHAAQHPEALAV